MLLRNLTPSDSAGNSTSIELNDGLPTIAAFARLCGHAISKDIAPVESLSAEALAILALGRHQGVFDIRGNKDAFESAERFLAVCIETDKERRLVMRNKSNPRQTLRFLEGFRELCQSGLIMHHTQRDFSLTSKGFEKAQVLNPDDYTELTQFAIEVEH